MANETVSQTPENPAHEMVDMVFVLTGGLIPENYAFSLWSEIAQILPWLKEEKNAGILPLRGSASGNNILLSKRSKLILRITAEHATQAAQLTGKQLNIGGAILIVGAGKQRQLLPTTTLHAHMVESNLGEIEFLADIKQTLQAMSIPCNLICDKYRKINDAEHSLTGFGLVLHDLKPQAAMQIQRSGLGGSRHFGCGIFVPFKAISGLD